MVAVLRMKLNGYAGGDTCGESRASEWSDSDDSDDVACDDVDCRLAALMSPSKRFVVSMKSGSPKRSVQVTM